MRKKDNCRISHDCRRSVTVNATIKSVMFRDVGILQIGPHSDISTGTYHTNIYISLYSTYTRCSDGGSGHFEYSSWATGCHG